MLYDRSMCFFILYHYKSNSILTTPIAGLDNVSIYTAYKIQFDLLTTKGFKPKLNVMDNQATKHIYCKLQLVELHNHHVNAAVPAIQTFKDAFIAALATTDSNFPLQLWDRLTQQNQDTLKILRTLHIDLSISAYEISNGPYGLKTDTPWPPWVARPSSTKMVTHKDHGH
jgi:hypothetical protein